MLSGYITELRQDINFVDTFITIIFIVQSGIHANFNFCNTYLFFTLLHHYHTICFKLNIICKIYRGVTSIFISEIQIYIFHFFSHLIFVFCVENIVAFPDLCPDSTLSKSTNFTNFSQKAHCTIILCH